ncbi:MAG TPA: LptE family protein [Terriglobales bacterium]|nr:LptE family protein [Terriglobales bacterium]
MKLAHALAALLALSFFSGCGYHSAGSASQLPPGVQTIAVPAFVNQTQTYRIEQQMTAAVVREFLTRTRYHVVNESGDAADAVLQGVVLSTEAAPLTYDSQTGRASSALVTVKMRVSLTGRDGKVLWENRDYVFREQYQVSREVSSFFQEESPALDRMSRDFARTLVSNILEAY